MNDWLSFRKKNVLEGSDRVTEDYHSEIVELTYMNDWLNIKLMYRMVVAWLLKDFHSE